MENKSSMPMTPFDEMITSPELQIMKALIPYMSGSAQKTTAACCKFLELRRTFHLFQGRRNGIHAQMFHDEDGAFSSFPDILEIIKPYLGSREQDMLDMIINMKSMMEMAEIMKETMGNSNGPSNPMDLAAAMLTPEQQEVFREYSDIFSGEQNSSANAGEPLQGSPHQDGSGIIVDHEEMEKGDNEYE
ncbi:MAG TPA: hypothetical protein H9730_00450 [Candidatus Mediterraneibacter stercoripullorum]|nr:hypothetical protein [Candidatus Mediterraneibacter stercoripullorum]